MVDTDPGSASYASVIGYTELPNLGDELHHFGWNACSSALCPTGSHTHGDRRYLVVPGLRSSRIYILDTLEDLTGIADSQQLAHLIERVGQLAVTGANVEVHIGIAGDLRVDKHHRLGIEVVLASLKRVPPSVRAAAVREGITTLQRLLALLLLHGWTDDLSGSAARQAAQRAIVDTVQGRVSAGQPAL